MNFLLLLEQISQETTPVKMGSHSWQTDKTDSLIVVYLFYLSLRRISDFLGVYIEVWGLFNSFVS
jgi:hypothetical protein